MSVTTRPLPIAPLGARRWWPESVDDVTVRLTAGIVLVLVVITLATQQWWLFVPLFADFAIRTLWGPRWGVTSRLAALLRTKVSAPRRPTASAPKRFAAGIGATMTGLASLALAATLLTDASWPVVALWVIGAIMTLFPALEAILGLCVGCKLFALLARFGVVDPDLCVDCVA